MKKDNQDKAQGKKPFFARLLETQELETVTGGIGDPPTNKVADTADRTLKYPSDTDERDL